MIFRGSSRLESPRNRLKKGENREEQGEEGEIGAKR
jgi:hypothetical protein